ncbi:MAG: hypothetical protein J0L97_02660 [Alphaproteobacteria bacterium]|nr:hypothetical protein [Alphaproteobacteria bacterium]
MAGIIYGSCALAALLCCLLLLRAYRASGYRVLLWGGLCFMGMTLNNVLLVIDKLVVPTMVDLSPWRLTVSLLSMLILLYGLIWDSE